MLNIKFKPDENTIEYIDSEFRKHISTEYLNDPYSEYIVKTIDNTIHIKDHIYQTAIRGMISEEQLSSGCKACLLMYWTNLEINATCCGDNCAKIIKEISDSKDITIVLEYLMKLYTIEQFKYKDTVYNGYSQFLSLWIQEAD